MPIIKFRIRIHSIAFFENLKLNQAKTNIEIIRANNESSEMFTLGVGKLTSVNDLTVAFPIFDKSSVTLEKNPCSLGKSSFISLSNSF